jgi:carbonic anhydrase
MSVVSKPDPGTALDLLKDGNQRFYSGRAAHPHADMKRIELAADADQGDHAYATVLACSDSRVPVEIIFDAGIMDLFITRVAGNVCGADEIGTIEYGLAHVRTPVAVVLGHTGCGAVTAATHELQGRCAQLECNVRPLVDAIGPACRLAAEEHPELRGDDLISYAIEENIWQGIRNLFMGSPITRDYVKQGRAKVVGGLYDLKTGRVEWLPEGRVLEILKAVEASPDKRTEASEAG